MNRYGEKLTPLIQSDDDGLTGVSSGRDLVMDGIHGMRFGSIHREGEMESADPKGFWNIFKLIDTVRMFGKQKS